MIVGSTSPQVLTLPGEAAHDGPPTVAAVARVTCDVLLVDDNEKLREVLALFLQCSGYSYQEASNGRTALALLAENNFRVIVTDIFMPDTDGFELISQCLARRPQTPIIAMSGSPDFDSGLMARMSTLLGATHILEKPFRMLDFQTLVRTILG